MAAGVSSRNLALFFDMSVVHLNGGTRKTIIWPRKIVGIPFQVGGKNAENFVGRKHSWANIQFFVNKGSQRTKGVLGCGTRSWTVDTNFCFILLIYASSFQSKIGQAVRSCKNFPKYRYTFLLTFGVLTLHRKRQDTLNYAGRPDRGSKSSPDNCSKWPICCN